MVYERVERGWPSKYISISNECLQLDVILRVGLAANLWLWIWRVETILEIDSNNYESYFKNYGHFDSNMSEQIY
jgi:hypothetical protein